MNTTTYHITHRQQIQNEVRELLNWSEQEFAQFQYEQGLKYLEAYLPNDNDGQAILSGEKLFWNWWKNHWAARDQEFIECAALCPISLAIELYESLHDGDCLAKEIHPSKVVIGDSFATENL